MNVTFQAITYFRNEFSKPTRDYLKSIPFESWDYWDHEDFPDSFLIFHDAESNHELYVILNDGGVVATRLSAATDGPNVWAPYADELRKLISHHEVQLLLPLWGVDPL